MICTFSVLTLVLFLTFESTCRERRQTRVKLSVWPAHTWSMQLILFFLVKFSLSVFCNSRFIRSLFPENLNAEKKGRPTTAGSKIKVCVCVCEEP